MTPGQLKRLGESDVWMTQLGLGGTGLGGMYAAVDSQAAIATVLAAHEAGVRYFDTAPMYGHGSSEERLGRALKEFDRSGVVLSTKVGRLLVHRNSDQIPADVFVDANPLAPVFDFSYEGTMRSLDESLRRLGVESVDVALIHDPDEGAGVQGSASSNHFDEAMGSAYVALAKLKNEGIVKAVGVGMNHSEMLCDFALAGDFDCFLLAGRYTLLDQSALDRLLPLCVDRGIGIILGGPYNSGILATGPGPGAHYNYKPAPADVQERARQLLQVCLRHGVSLQAAALQFPLGHPSVVSVIPGARTPTEALANALFFKEVIPSAFWEELQSMSLIRADAPVPQHMKQPGA